MRSLVGKDLWRIKAVDRRCVVGFKKQQFAIFGFGAVDHDKVQTNSVSKRAKGGLMARHEHLVERFHHLAFLGAFARITVHSGVAVMHIPVIADRHMAEEGTAPDQCDAKFAVLPIGRTIIDERRHIKLRCGGGFYVDL